MLVLLSGVKLPIKEINVCSARSQFSPLISAAVDLTGPVLMESQHT